MKVFAVIVTTLALVVGFAAAAVTGPGMSCGKHNAGCCAKSDNVERTVETITNGVRITMSAKDAKDIAKIQECADKCAQNESGSCPMHGKDVTRNVEKTSTGVIITATATDLEVVKTLQAHSSKMKAGGCGHHGEKAMKSGCAKGHEASGNCCAKDANVERTVETITNGVRITMSAKDAKDIAKIQECADKCAQNESGSCPMHGKDVTRNVEKTSTGVIITATATDLEVVKVLQAHSSKMKAGGCGHHGEKAMKSGCAKGHEVKKSCCDKGQEAKKDCGM